MVPICFIASNALNNRSIFSKSSTGGWFGSSEFGCALIVCCDSPVSAGGGVAAWAAEKYKFISVFVIFAMKKVKPKESNYVNT